MSDDYVYYITFYKLSDGSDNKLTIQIGEGKELLLDEYEENMYID